MSRIGRKPITLPSGVQVKEQDGQFSVKGPLGNLTLKKNPYVALRQEGSELLVERCSEEREASAHHGMVRNLLSNMVTGVSKGFERKLEIVGVGFKAEVNGRVLNMNLGYSHPIAYPIPDGIEIKVDRNTKIAVNGIDNQLVGQVAANIKGFRWPDPYKGKGIRYAGERIKLKAGKTGAT